MNKINKYFLASCGVITPFTIGLSTWIINDDYINTDTSLKTGNLSVEVIDSPVLARLENPNIYFDLRLGDNILLDNKLQISILGNIIDNYNEFTVLYPELQLNEEDSKSFEYLIDKGYIHFSRFSTLTKNSPQHDLNSTKGTFWTDNNESRSFKICAEFTYCRFFNYMSPNEFFNSNEFNGIKNGLDYTKEEISKIIEDFSSVNNLKFNIVLSSIPNKTPYYKVSYDLNGGYINKELSTTRYEVGSLFHIASEIPIKQDYEFLYWSYTNKNGEKITLTPNQEVKLERETFGDETEIVLKAEFAENPTDIATNLFILRPGNGIGSETTVNLRTGSTLFSDVTYGFSASEGYHFIGWKYNGKIFPSNTKIDETNFTNSSLGSTFILEALYLKDQCIANYFNKNNELIYQEIINTNENNYKIPSASTFSSMIEGKLSRVKLTKYSLYFNFESTFNVENFLKYNNLNFVFNFLVLDKAPSSIEIEYQFNDLTYIDFIESFADEISYQLLKYDTFVEFGLTFGGDISHHYQIEGLDESYNESEYLIINYDNFPYLAYNNKIIIKLIEDGVGIEIWLHEGQNSRLIEKDGTIVDGPLERGYKIIRVPYDYLFEIEFNNNPYYKELDSFSKWEYWLGNATEESAIEVETEKLSLKINDESENLSGISKIKELHVRLQGSTCFSKNTYIKISNDSYIPVSKLKLNDEVKVFNQYTGKIENANLYLIVKHQPSIQSFIRLNFSHKISIEIIGNHELFSTTFNKYLEINPANVKDFVGTEFLYTANNQVRKCKLLSYKINEKEDISYTIVTKNHLNVIANKLVTLTPNLQGTNSYFKLNKNHTINKKSFNSDIEKYGLFEYDEWSSIMSKDLFEAFNIKYFKISFAKGLANKETICNYVKYLNSLFEKNEAIKK